MKRPGASLQLVGGVRDLQIVDRDDRKCGIADELEFEGGPGGDLTIKAILVGPGAYAGRLPAWAMWLVRRIGGRRMVRVPWSKVRSIDAMIRLSATASELGLDSVEKTAERLLPHKGAY
jgi:hypothetical protein